jgi:phage-related protein
LYNVFKIGLSYIKNAQAAAYGAANAMKLLKDAWVASIDELASDLKSTFESIKVYIKDAISFDEFVAGFYELKRGANQIFDDLSRDFNAVINKVGEIIDNGIGYFTDFKDAILNELQPTTDAIKGFVQPIIDFIQNIVKTITDGIAGFNAMGSAIESVKSKLPKSLFKEEEESVFKKALKKYTDEYDFAMKKMTKSEEERIKERNKLLTDDAKDKAEKAKAESKLTAEQQESLNKSLYELRKQRLVFAQTLAKEEAADEQNIFEDRLESFKVYENKKKAEIELTRRFEISGVDKAAKSEGEKGLMIAKINENAK